MISDLTTPVGTTSTSSQTLSPAGVPPASVPCAPCAPSVPSSPLSDIGAYLESRSPTPHFCQEDPLYITLPASIRSELRQLLGASPGCGMFGYIRSRVAQRASVGRACAEARPLFPQVPGSLKRLRARYDLWSKSGDWVSLVNRAKAGPKWQAPRETLPDAFLDYCASRFARAKRWDSKRQVILSIKRQWLTGRDDSGKVSPIPGYEKWQRRLAADVPVGWSYSNILAQIKARSKFTDAVRALAHQGTYAAREFIPRVLSDRNTDGEGGQPLRFLERVEFDDVKCDFLVIDPATGHVCDLWLLVARDRGTGILLGFTLRPALSRPDGTQEHLRLTDMKQLCGWILERYGLPPYLCTWKIEHGTATLTPGSVAMLRELLPNRINVSYSSMIGGKSPDGYKQRAVGNSAGKASLESHNRLQHTMSAEQPGQTGPLYTVRPADLPARVAESVEIWKTTQHLPDHLRNQVGYTVLTIAQARDHLTRIFRLQNQRTEHKLQGFEDVVEIWTGEKWIPQSQVASPSLVGTTSTSSPIAPSGAVAGALAPAPLGARVRKESPLERASRLLAPYTSQWTFVSPDTIRAFYDHTAREVVVKPNGLITFLDMQFEAPENAGALVPGTKLLAYYHPDDPALIYLTNHRGSIVGVWVRRTRGAVDQDALSAAIAHTQRALRAVKDRADHLAAPERERLDQIRANNAALIRTAAEDDFTPVFDLVGTTSTSSPSSPLSESLAAIAAARAARKQTAAQTAQTLEDTRDLLINAML